MASTRTSPRPTDTDTQQTPNSPSSIRHPSLHATKGVPPLLCPGETWHTAAVKEVVLKNCNCKTFRKCKVIGVEANGTLHLQHMSKTTLADGSFGYFQFKSSDKGVMLVFDGVVNYAYVQETLGKGHGEVFRLFS